MKTITLLLVAIVSATSLQSATYYVDANTGNDTNTGLSATQAWKTIEQVNTIRRSLAPGDSILFRRGAVWRGQVSSTAGQEFPEKSGQLKIYSSGTASAPITIGSYDTDPSTQEDAPVISGVYKVTNAVWDRDENNVETNYRRKKSWPLEPQQVFFTVAGESDRRGTRKNLRLDAVDPFDWFYEDKTLYYTYDGAIITLDATAYVVGDVPDVSGPVTTINASKSIYARPFTGWTGESQWAGQIPSQVFFNGEKGRRVGGTSPAVADLEIPDPVDQPGANNKTWYYDSVNQRICYRFDPRGTVTGLTVTVEAAAPLLSAAVVSNDKPMRPAPYALEIQGSYVDVIDVEFAKTERAAVVINTNSDSTLLEGVTLRQWTNARDGSVGGVQNNGTNTEVRYSTFGRNSGAGNEEADQNWAGLIGIYSAGKNAELHHNAFYHSAIESDNSAGNSASAIVVTTAQGGVNGIVKVHDNTIFHVGGNGIKITGSSVANDEYRIYNNTVTYSGQAGIAAYQTRGAGTGAVYGNTVRYSNRLGGVPYVDDPVYDLNPNRAAGIHFNDGVPAGSYIGWTCHDNVISNSMSLFNTEKDSEGIAMDFNANGVEVFRNQVHSCFGKAIYIYNASNCRVHHNIAWKNDMGISVTSDDTGTGPGQDHNNTLFADNNWVFNNVFYKNENSNNPDAYNNNVTDPGFNLRTEVYFGKNGNYNKFYNNIIYPFYGQKRNGDFVTVRAMVFITNGDPIGCVSDYNLFYSDAHPTEGSALLFNVHGGSDMNRASWFSAKGWDHQSHSVYGDPAFTNPATSTFTLQSGSPAINRGIWITPEISDGFAQALITVLGGTPDIGRYEKQ